jgi:hypothetical protein
MEDFISSILNSNFDFNKIGAFFLLWIGALWLVFCVWVNLDAKKRYKSKKWGLFWAAAVFVLNFPALVFYFIVRPENEENHIIYFANEGSQPNGGINVPLINFTGQDGLVQLSLSLSLNKNIGENVQFDVKVNDNENYKVQEKEVNVEVETQPEVVTETSAPVTRKVTISSLKSNASSFKKNIKSKLAKKRTDKKAEKVEDTSEKSI